jgi:hypothetical protein
MADGRVPELPFSREDYAAICRMLYSIFSISAASVFLMASILLRSLSTN